MYGTGMKGMRSGEKGRMDEEGEGEDWAESMDEAKWQNNKMAERQNGRKDRMAEKTGWQKERIRQKGRKAGRL